MFDVGRLALSATSLRLIDPTFRTLPVPGVVIDDLYGFTGIETLTHGCTDLAGIRIEVDEDAPVLSAIVACARHHIDPVDSIVTEEFRKDVSNAGFRDIVENAGDADRRAVVEESLRHVSVVLDAEIGMS